MVELLMHSAVTIIMLVAANYLYQWFTARDWDKALDRSWCQAVAMALFAVSIRGFFSTVGN